MTDMGDVVGKLWRGGGAAVWALLAPSRLDGRCGREPVFAPGRVYS